MPEVSDVTHPAVLRELDSITVRLPTQEVSGDYRMETSQVSPRKVSRIIALSFQKLKGTSGSQKFSRTLQGKPPLVVHLQTAFVFVFLPCHHQLMHMLVRFYIQHLFLSNCQAMNLQKFSFFVPKGVTLIYTRGKIKFRCSPLLVVSSGFKS